jgi:sugar phosphate permease
VGRRAVLIGGIVLFASGCVAFVPASPNIAVLGVLFAAVGASTGMVETAQGSHAAELLEPSIRGRGFGLLGLVEGVGDLVSSVVVGALWTITDPAWGFVFAAILAVVGALVLTTTGRGPRHR